MTGTDARKWMTTAAGSIMIIAGCLDLFVFAFFAINFITEVSSDWFMLLPLFLCVLGLGVGAICFHGGLSALNRNRWVYTLVSAILAGLSYIGAAVLVIIIYIGNNSGGGVNVVLLIVLFVLIVAGGLPLIFVLESRKQFQLK
ncbi:MAG: hypothetical protein ABR886_10050 [Dehalococcoidales bacterium]|jgi:hypothetical protein